MPSQSVPVLGEVGMALVSESEKTFAEESYKNTGLGIFIIEMVL